MVDNYSRLLTEREKLEITPEPFREVIFRHTHVASKVSVGWAWYNEGQGTVEWSFRNSDAQEHSVVLLRNGYYFAGAFWPVYYENSDGRGASATNPSDNFGTNFLGAGSQISPLTDKGVARNNPPLGLITFDNPDAGNISSSNSQVLFVFTLKAGETWSMLEGGFSASMTPSNISLHELHPLSHGSFCIGYDPKRVTDWDNQTSTSLKGYSPNPITMATWLLEAEKGAPFLELPYKDSYADGACKV